MFDRHISLFPVQCSSLLHSWKVLLPSQQQNVYIHGNWPSDLYKIEVTQPAVVMHLPLVQVCIYWFKKRVAENGVNKIINFKIHSPVQYMSGQSQGECYPSKSMSIILLVGVQSFICLHNSTKLSSLNDICLCPLSCLTFIYIQIMLLYQTWNQYTDGLNCHFPQSSNWALTSGEKASFKFSRTCTSNIPIILPKTLRSYANCSTSHLLLSVFIFCQHFLCLHNVFPHEMNLFMIFFSFKEGMLGMLFIMG